MYYGQSIATGGGSEKPIDQILHEKYFPDKKDGFFIEAGANDGIFISTCKFFEDIGWNGINIEPSKELFGKLIINRLKSKNLMVALSDKKGIGTFEDVDADHNGFNRMGNSVINDLITKAHGICVCDAYQVKTITYCELVETNNIGNVDLFVLDVEGYELEVIQGMAQTTVFPKIFCVEHAHIGLGNIEERLKTVSNGLYNLDFYDTLNAIFARKP